MKKIFPLVLFIAFANQSHAAVQDYMPEAKLKPSDASKWNIGAGATMQLAHLNAEWVNPYGIAYAKMGMFVQGENPFGAQVGFRYPVILTGKDKNGYYLGAYAGHLKSKTYGKDGETQLGGGVDLSYVLLNKERISTFSVGLGMGEKVTVGNTTVLDSKPLLQLAYTLSVGF
ncbi:hypothetical protein EC844_102120 [Acinetobacter calcoaceticus]|uniref:Uncharacterized protein n=1 Tax=Acinetobacter calcoaceticus TaxID=471 RepID=A0A4R1Y9V2_ACICA|nr:hypothetical protein EC844_102120 [Acinetobacter calcoaceticus]